MSATVIERGCRERAADAIAALCQQQGIGNRFAGPRIEKVVLNMGVGRAVQDGQILNIVAEHLSQIAGQRVVITKAKKAISNFRSRADMKIGCMVTLRGARMWAFLDKLIQVAIPRIRDFRGLSPKGFDKGGSYNMGLTEQALFPEVVLEKLEHNQGLNISVVFRNSDPEKSLLVLKGIGMPFRER